MRYRLPLELELAILELAAPPLAYDSLHDRVDFFINAALVHRSFTAWAQDRLRDQFLYTYRARPDEHARLKSRFEAGFAGRDRPLRRLYLDLGCLPEQSNRRKEAGIDSVSVMIKGRVYGPVSAISGPGSPNRTDPSCEAVAHYVHPANDPYNRHWELCTMITTYAQALNTLWLKLPLIRLEIAGLPPPRILLLDDLLDDDGANVEWGWFRTLPLSSETVLFLRNIGIDTVRDTGDLDTRHLVFDKCWWADLSATDLLVRFHQLETLVLFETEGHDLVWLLADLPTTMRRVYLLQQEIRIDEARRNNSIVLPRLESFTSTWLQPDRESHRLADADSDALAELPQAVESITDAPQCTFKYLRSTQSPEDALADALAALEMDL